MNESRERLERYLRVNPKEGYINAPLPSVHDREIAGICRGLNVQDDYERTMCDIAHLEATLLPPFSERMAVLAVRKRDEQWVVLGLRAAALASRIEEIRSIVINLALLWHSAELIGLTPDSPFGRVAQEAGGFGEAITTFAGRAPKDKSISAMMYSAHGEGENFTYRCDW